MYVIDNFFIRWAQEAYNYVWNNFGITKGAILAITFLILAILNYLDDAPLWLRILSIGFCFFFADRAIKEHLLQKNGSYNIINRFALFKRESLIHSVFRVLILSNIFLSLFFGLRFFHYIIFTWFYIDTCLVQDRELPKNRTEYSHGY